MSTLTENEIESLRLDAARYHFLRDKAFLDSPDSAAEFAKLEAFTGVEFDKQIDGLMLGVNE